MQIQPLQPVEVSLKCGQSQATCHLIELTDCEMQLTSTDYLEKGSLVVFTSRFFRGEASILHLKFCRYHFSYTLKIDFINFQPGLVVNQKL
ncbi:hypothetical protein BN59_00532 [Legionella massiliensis]|uniref:Uncharacterized protein n=1 Tax=Legionella massiliensis TaxID=1034943 RepID=A0A078KPD5_9GAMM|nr:hypothetical protein [Legionella massiliensis]CDZ76265.1 hypothetical protein BN59_00532 [Legionella massiliensis]CEE12003.1 hypothetical protein BN1094_00532 [Legionella massiliensis]